MCGHGRFVSSLQRLAGRRFAIMTSSRMEARDPKSVIHIVMGKWRGHTRLGFNIFNLGAQHLRACTENCSSLDPIKEACHGKPAQPDAQIDVAHYLGFIALGSGRLQIHSERRIFYGQGVCAYNQR